MATPDANGDAPEQVVHAKSLSDRGKNANIALLPMTYFAPIADMLKNLWTPGNHSGCLILAVAENRLSTDLLAQKLCRGLQNIPDDIYGYPPGRGMLRLRSTLAQYAQKTFMKGVQLHADDITVLAGCGCVLDLLLYCIAADGDLVGIPAPYYPAFDNDLKVRCGLEPVPLYLDSSKPLSEQLDAMWDAHKFKVLIITNPNNPTGEVIQKAVLLQYLDWCCKNGVHLVSDEIYANSVFRKAEEFVSLASLLEESEPELKLKAQALCHVVFGLSKDWGISGMRVGCLYTHNTAVIGALDNLGYFAMPSTLIQETAHQMLQDQDFVDLYIAENLRRLDASYSALTGALDRAGIPYTPATGAIFLWVDMRKYLSEPTWQAERQLWQEVVDLGVLLTPGKDCHAQEPGYFRICYAAVPTEGLVEAIGRIAAHLQQRSTS
ncbi:1-aminocyclopropane-1-carboxylate synthase [Coccomyxa sp. Obi]|nr:1-aminocyclopropane-1-carboxylate synthase [Coccomyxa sp. Obi]